MDIYKLLGINRLEAVLNRVNRKPIKEDPSLCCRDRLHGSGCALCLKCPVGAINLDREPFLDEDTCLHCGLCATLCPTGVFTPEPGDDYYLAIIKSTLVKSKADQEQTALVFHCSKAAHKDELKANIELPCLARLNETLFLGSANFGVSTVWLLTANCSDCPLGSCLETLKELAAKSKQVVKGYGLNFKIIFSSEPPQFNQEASRADDVKKDVSAYSRRELFTQLGRQVVASGIEYTESKWQELKENMRGPAVPEFAYKVPRKRELLLAVLNSLEKQRQVNGNQPLNPFLYFYDIDASRCNFCFNCVKFCPTKALRLAANEDGGHLVLVWPYCVGCNLCTQVCLTNAITAKQSALSLKEKKFKVLISFQESKCEECKQPFYTVNLDQKRCFFCEQRRAKLQDDFF